MGSNDITAMGPAAVPLLASTGTTASVSNDFPDTGKGFEDADHTHINFVSELDGKPYEAAMQSDEKHPEWGFEGLLIYDKSDGGRRFLGALNAYTYNADAQALRRT